MYSYIQWHWQLCNYFTLLVNPGIYDLVVQMMVKTWAKAKTEVRDIWSKVLKLSHTDDKAGNLATLTYFTRIVLAATSCHKHFYRFKHAPAQLITEDATLQTSECTWTSRCYFTNLMTQLNNTHAYCLMLLGQLNNTCVYCLILLDLRNNPMFTNTGST